jgi:hypothetical protein
MARRPKGTTVKSDSAATFAKWQARAAAALEAKHAIKAGTIPVRVWRHAYVRGLTPEEGAEHAARSAYNVRPASERLHKHRR